MILTTITARTSNGTQAYSIGGQPKAILIWTDGQASAGLDDGYRWLQGMSDGVLQVCRSVAMDDSLGSPPGVQVDAPDVIYRMCATVASGSASTIQEASLVSFDAGGFTLDWTVTNGSATRIHVLAFTEDDVDDALLVRVFCDSNPEIITGVGFAPRLVITLGSTRTNLAVPGASGPSCAMPTFGFSDGTENFCGDTMGRAASNTTPRCAVWGAAPSSAASTVIRYISSIFSGFVATGINIANVVPDGFDASKSGFGASSLYHYFLALSTPLEVKIGYVPQQAAAGSVSLDLDFEPSVIALIATGDRMSAGDTTSQGAYAMGAWLASDDSTIHAFAGTRRVSSVNHTARANGTGALKFYTVDPTGASSTLAMAVSVTDEGQSLTFDTSDGDTRAVIYVALGAPIETEINRCEGGVVPQVPDPPDGYSPDGLGPHEDRFFIETDLTDAGTQLWALQDPMRDSPALVEHAGHKEGRIITCGSIIRRSTDRLGAWNAATARWTADDHDRTIRGLMAAEPWYSREFRPYLCDRTDVENARCLGRFIVQDHPPSPELLVEVEGLDIINTEFSPFALDRDILSSVVFNLAMFANLPKALADLSPPQPIPVYGGRWSDIGSGEGAPVLTGAAWRGTHVGNDGRWEMGFGDMPAGGPSPPDSVTGTAIAGGSIDLGYTPYNAVYAQVWAITGGQAGDPEPFYPELLEIPITANDSKLRIEWTFAGTDPDSWGVAIAAKYYGARWLSMLIVDGADRSVEFTNLPVLIGSGGGQSPGATVPYGNRAEFVVVAVMSDGFTGASAYCIHPYNGPYARPVHVTWFPVDGALSYVVYRAGVPSVYFGIVEKFSVPADSIDSDGFAYFDYDWITVGEAVTEIDSPKGVLPVWDTGDEILSDGQPWGRLVLCRWPVAEIEDVRQGGEQILDSNDLLHPDHANWSSYFANRYITVNGVDLTILYARGAILERHRGAAGGSTAITAGTDDSTFAPIQVSACTTEDIGNGLGNVITIGPRLAQHMLAELVRNDHLTGTWTGIPAFPDGVYEIKTSSYLAAENTEIARVGEGYPSHMAFIQPTTVRQFFEQCCQGLALHHAIDHHGRVTCGHYDDAIDFETEYRTFKDIREITGDIRTIPMTSALENRIPYQADFRPVENQYAIRDVYVEDEAAITRNRGKVKAGPQRLTQFAATVTTWADVLNRALILGKYVRTWVEVPVGIVGLNIDIFQIFRVTDEAGISASGWDGEYVLCLEHEIIPPDPSADRPTLVVLKGLDITSIVEAAWVWAPLTVPATWDLMSTDQRRTYGAFASAAGTIPTLNSPGKEWR